jgi:hypothetical protein
MSVHLLSNKAGSMQDSSNHISWQENTLFWNKKEGSGSTQEFPQLRNN